MTDLEISKALALAIGWDRVQIIGGSVLVYTGNPHHKVFYNKNGNWVYNNRVFDYRDWNVIGPIAEKYNCFPSFDSAEGGWWSSDLPFGHGDITCERTPQKTIALAVIEGAKK